jgi:hypothetical protein
MLNEQIISGKPNVVFDIRNEVVIGLVPDGKQPQIHFNIRNIGKRNAENCRTFLFLIYSDYTKVFDIEFKTPRLEPNTSTKGQTFNPIISLNYEKKFFLVVKILYYDNKTETEYSNTIIYKINERSYLYELNESDPKLTQLIAQYISI